MSARSPRLSCPSSSPAVARSRVLGVVGPGGGASGAGSGGRRVTFLATTIPVGRELRALAADAAAPADVTEFLRFTSTCATTGCAQFRDGVCGVARRVLATTAPVTDELPECGIRDTCRWFAQEGAAACVRCPAVVTDTLVPIEAEAGEEVAS